MFIATVFTAAKQTTQIRSRPSIHMTYLRGRLKRGARAVQLFGHLIAVETHTLWYFGHHCCLVVSFDALGIWHFWMFTLFHPFLLFCTQFLPISTTSTLLLGSLIW